MSLPGLSRCVPGASVVMTTYPRPIFYKGNVVTPSYPRPIFYKGNLVMVHFLGNARLPH